MQIGTGLIFRNQHELLLYADRGKMPKPVEVPSSVFRYQRTAHSAKPPEIRQTLERMYPFFGKEQRAELFSRGEQDGWTSFGNEAGN
jgi:N6-adenosine-specific RNA methylase IME4